MKKVLFALVAVAGLFATAGAASAGEGGQSVGLDVRYASIGGDADKFATGGPVVGLNYMYGINKDFGVGLAIDQYMFGKKGGVTYSVTDFSLFGRYYLPLENAPVRPFGTVGLAYGSSHTKLDASIGGGSQNDSGLGFMAGVGAAKEINEMWEVELLITYRTFAKIKSTPSDKTANAMDYGVGVNYKFGK